MGLKITRSQRKRIHAQNRSMSTSSFLSARDLCPSEMLKGGGTDFCGARRPRRERALGNKASCLTLRPNVEAVPWTDRCHRRTRFERRADTRSKIRKGIGVFSKPASQTGRRRESVRQPNDHSTATGVSIHAILRPPICVGWWISILCCISCSLAVVNCLL